MSALSAAPGAAGSTSEILEGLNPEQRAAVTHGEGPLLIVAGAGTGKTAVLTRRIAWLIATKRARPEEILALTFTDKAATEMETRVDRLVPYGYVGATLSTFHAFCDRLVRQHAIELGLTHQLRVESRAEILVFLRERVFELGLARYLPLGSPDQHLQSLLALFDRARDEDVSPAQYLAFAQRLAADAEDDEQRDRAESQLELARAYANYERIMLEHGRIDFGSQIGLALRLLRERPYLRREIQDQYRYVLVDEFQDTNHVQFELVQLLAGARSNLTVVGDDDQSIYCFRGAKVENLMGFVETHPDARVVLLRSNYRSGQNILDHAHRLIQFNNPERFEARDPVRFDKRLEAVRPGPGVVEHLSFDTGSSEVDAIAAEIAEGVEGGRAARDFAVLARTHAHLDPMALALQARGVRFQRGSTVGLYRRPEVLLCLAVLRTLADPESGTAAFQVFADPLFAVDAVDLARLCAAAQARNRGLLRVAAEAAAAPAPDLAPESVAAIRRYAALHQRLAVAAARRPSYEVLYEFAAESGLLQQLSEEQSAEAAERAQNLNKLFGIVQRVGSLLKHDRVIHFIGHLDLLIAAGDDPSAAVVENDEDAVRLLTAHNAKGLEFPVVYLIGLTENRFPTTIRSDALPFPPELLRRHGDAREDHYREERRLFYVGMTRAQDRLVLSHAADYGGRATMKPSRFVVEALKLPVPPKTRRPATALEHIQRYAPVAEPAAPELAPLPPDQPLRVSHGQINDYLTCPLKYRYAHVMKVPLGSDPLTMYGIAMHHAIKVYLRHRLKGLPIAADDVVAAFESAWSSEGFYSREHEELRLEEGRRALRGFVAREEASPRTPLAVEMDFKFPIGIDVMVGRFDRIDETPEGIVLVDYKTSEVEEPGKAAERAAKSLKNEQLGLYALAYWETRKVLPARVELNFVGSGVVGSAPVTLAPIERARARVRTATAGIRAAQFPADPDQRKCGDCPYSRFCPHSAARA